MGFRRLSDLLLLDQVPELALRDLGRGYVQQAAAPEASRGEGSPRSGEAPPGEAEGLYVPVTRKVSLTDETGRPPGIPCGYRAGADYCPWWDTCVDCLAGDVTPIRVTVEQVQSFTGEFVQNVTACTECDSVVDSSGRCLACTLARYASAQ